MNVSLKLDVLLEPLNQYLHFQDRLFLMFDSTQLIIHGVDSTNTCYTKVLISRAKMEHYFNNFSEKKTYESKLNL